MVLLSSNITLSRLDTKDNIGWIYASGIGIAYNFGTITLLDSIFKNGYCK